MHSLGAFGALADGLQITGKIYAAGGRCPENATEKLLADKCQYITSVSGEIAYYEIAYDKIVKLGKACQLFRSGESSGARQYNPQSAVLPIAPYRSIVRFAGVLVGSGCC